MSEDEKAARLAALERLLGRLEGDPAFAIIEDRAHDGGHLEEDDYARLAVANPGDASITNLKRHVLFCDLCGTEFLRRALPSLAAAEVAPSDPVRPERWRLPVFGVLIVVAVAAIVVLDPWEWWQPPSSPDRSSSIPAPVVEPPSTFGTRPRAARIETSRDPGAPAERLVIDFEPATPRTLLLHPFVITASTCHAITPSTLTAGIRRAVVAVEDSSVLMSAQRVLLLITQIQPPLLADAELRDALAQRLFAASSNPGTSDKDLQALAEELRGSAPAQAFILPITR